MDIERILKEMTLEDKIALCSGASFWETKRFERYGIPALFMCDGPHGLRKQEDAADMLGVNNSRPATCFPAPASAGRAQAFRSARPSAKRHGSRTSDSSSGREPISNVIRSAGGILSISVRTRIWQVNWQQALSGGWKRRVSARVSSILPPIHKNWTVLPLTAFWTGARCGNYT